MHPGVIIIYTLSYLSLLFGIAFYIEKRTKNGSRLFNNPYVYSLSLAVYCTAWTFFGSVGRATNTGVEFLYIYLGPTFGAPVILIILRKIIVVDQNILNPDHHLQNI